MDFFLPITKCQKKPESVDFRFSQMTSHLEPILNQIAVYIEKQCISSSDSDVDSTVISNSEGSQYVESDQWDFEETTEQNYFGNAFGGIVEPYHFEPYASNSEEDGNTSSVGEDERLVVCSLQIGRFCFSVQLTVYKGYRIN